MELIDRLGVMKALDDAKIKTTSEEYDRIIDVIGSMPTINRWIPAKERLPEETGFYLCTLPMYHEEPMVDVCLFDKATGGFFNSGGSEYYIVAWMPLPKPYKESDESEKENDSERSD